MAISAVAGRIFNIGKRVVKMSPNYILGNGNEVFGKVFESSWKAPKPAGANVGFFKRLGQCVKNAGLAAEKASAGKSLKVMLKEFAKIPVDIKTAAVTGFKSGTGFWSKLWGGIKGTGKGISGKIPGIGTLIMIGFELPNIIKATADEGIVSGLGECVKTATRLGAGLTGAAIGQALIPIPVVGSLVGWMAGDWIASKIVGKSYSERKAEREEQAASAVTAYEQASQAETQAQTTSQAVTNPFGTTPQQQWLMYQTLNQGGFGMQDDFMANAYKDALKLNYQA